MFSDEHYSVELIKTKRIFLNTKKKTHFLVFVNN